MEPSDIIGRNMVEVITREELRGIDLSHAKAYQGFEPSGLPHIATALLWPKKLNDVVSTGVDVTILLADWHALVNDKLDGDLERIRASGMLFMEGMRAMGLSDAVKFLWASDLIENGSYMTTLLRVAKSTTMPRLIRALPIMGRSEKDVSSDFSKLIYPLMQVTDIIEMQIDIAIGAMDQRHAHMLCRDIQEKLHMRKTVAVHGPLLSSLKGTGRMDVSTQGFKKMSKSDPDSAIFLFDSEDDIRRKIKSAFCPARKTEGNPIVDIMERIIIPYSGRDIIIDRPRDKGGELHVESVEQFRRLYESGDIHPLDVKSAVSEILIDMLKPAIRLTDRLSEKIEFVRGS